MSPETVWDVREVLVRLKRRLGRMRGRYHRLYATAQGASKERAYGEENICSLAMGFIDVELRKLEPTNG